MMVKGGMEETMSERVREVLLREVRLMHESLRVTRGNKQTEIVPLSPQTVLHSLGLIDRIAIAIGGKGRKLVKEMREVGALVAQDFRVDREWSSTGKPVGIVRPGVTQPPQS